MKLSPLRVEVDVDGTPLTAALHGSPVTLGPVQVAVEGSTAATGGWRVANRSDRAVRLRRVSVVFALEDVTGPVRMLRQGYQSWSPTGVATLGVDRDPSLAPGSLELIRAAAHADPAVVEEGELRSEWVTVLADRSGRLLVGFDGGHRHDGTIRLRQAEHGGVEVSCEAHLGGASLDGGAERELHALVVDGRDLPPSELLTAFAAAAGRRAAARVGAPYQVGWCSWYHYFHAVTEADLRANLARAREWPFEVFQLDDGFQRSIGDWLQTNEKFPSDLDRLADSIAAAGRRPGLWIAPFLVAPDSEVATAHPGWLVRLPNGEPLPGCFNPPWGGGAGGLMWILDTTNPEVLAHLEHVARELVAAGFTYLKLDFTYAASFGGQHADETRTPAERVREGFAAIRRGAGEDSFLLGCGVPLANVIGLVDGNRIGADVAPEWGGSRTDAHMAGYLEMLPATRHAAANTCTRSFMHRTLWLNDPDCLMLREAATELNASQVETWARLVGVSGGMALVSDDLSLLDGRSRRLLDEVVALGRAADAEARAGHPARSEDLFEADEQPSTLRAGGHRLVVDPATGRSRLETSDD